MKACRLIIMQQAGKPALPGVFNIGTGGPRRWLAFWLRNIMENQGQVGSGVKKQHLSAGLEGDGKRNGIGVASWKELSRGGGAGSIATCRQGVRVPA